MHVAVLTGGESPEREVAFWSAENVVGELERAGLDVSVFDVPSELETFLKHRARFSCVVPVLHGGWGEDGTIQGFLETLNMPYIFSGVTASAVAMDKAIAKDVVRAAGLKTPPSVRSTSRHHASFVYDHPVVVKPIPCGSTLGVTVVRSSQELSPALDAAFRLADTVLVEDWIDGREFTVPVVEDAGKTRALEVIEINISKRIFSFEEKYAKGNDAFEICPAPIEDEWKERLQTLATTAHQVIGARHFTRTDFMVDARGVAWFLEINTIPGMTAHSLTNKALAVEKRTFGELLLQWIHSVV